MTFQHGSATPHMNGQTLCYTCSATVPKVQFVSLIWHCEVLATYTLIEISLICWLQLVNEALFTHAASYIELSEGQTMLQFEWYSLGVLFPLQGIWAHMKFWIFYSISKQKHHYELMYNRPSWIRSRILRYCLLLKHLCTTSYTDKYYSKQLKRDLPCTLLPQHIQ
jgi:hypothetical protein